MKQVTLIKDVVTEVIHVEEEAKAINYQPVSSDWPVSPDIAIPEDLHLSFETVGIRVLEEARRPKFPEEALMAGPEGIVRRRWHFAISERVDRALPFSIEGMFRRNEELEHELMLTRGREQAYKNWWAKESKLNFEIAHMGRWQRFKFLFTGRLPEELRPVIRVVGS